MKRTPGTCFLIMAIIAAGVLFLDITSCQKNCCTIGFVVATDSVSAITDTTARCGGTIASDDEDTVLSRGVCWSMQRSPTIKDPKTTDSIGKGKFSSEMTKLMPNTRYYVRAYVTNKKGEAYGDEKSFKTNVGPVFTIGKSYGGGIIFHIDSTGVNGLIAAKTDEKNAAWGCSGVLIPGPDSTGQFNTLMINYACKQPDIAAWICTQVSSGNYKDWFLPSKDELNLLFLQKHVVGGLTNGIYWSSTQGDKDSAWGIDFSNGSQEKRNKDSLFHVRAVRSF
ncbi:MAG: DUF1566 domain-containing protein [Bacteroidales bacterium]|nr:DUF1566 domain-containing protein [Bacteroidales bacterium]